MSEGWFILHRGWRENHIFKGEFSRADAWVWLIENASWKPIGIRIKGDRVELARGELSFAVRFMADAWGWSKSRVDRFLGDLRDEGMIETRSKIGTSAGHNAGQGQSILSICNYAKYQDVTVPRRDNDPSETGTTAGQQRDKEEQGNKGTINNRLEPSGSKARARVAVFLFICPEGVDPIDWQALIDNRKAKRAPLTEGAHRQIVKKLETWARAGWPPGPVVAFAAERGWTSVFETDEMKAGHNGHNHQNSGNRGQRDNRDGVAKALDRRLAQHGLDEPSGAFGRCDVIGGSSDGGRPAAALAIVPRIPF